MPGTYACIRLHIVFSTKGREPWIADELASRLHAYMGGIIRERQGVPLSIGGVEDHVHALVGWRTDAAIADLLRHLKTRSSRWVHETIGIPEFAWQEGYAVFSVSKSHTERVKLYIQNQREHHRTRSFKEELIALLDAHGVEYDARYVFD
jgi:REP element-mobilizing transposase RayT